MFLRSPISKSFVVGSLFLSTAFFSFPPSHVEAQSWLEKGLNIFQSVKQGNVAQELTVGDMAGAFKDALRIGSGNVVSRLGAVDGFNADSAIHIPLPDELGKVKSMLSKVGMSQSMDDLELKLNRAAEAATPKARELFSQAISDMTFDDVKQIYNGPEDSATQYFRGKMSPDLIKEMDPIIDGSLSEVGAIQSYDTVMGQYKALPFVPDVKADLKNHVSEKALDGVFYYLAKEEAAIRSDPARHTTDLLKRVFGGK